MMINTKKILKIGSIFTLVLVLFAACDLTELDTLDSPNALNPTQSDPDLFINKIQLDFAKFFESGNTDNFVGANEFGAEVTRMLHMFGPTYSNAYSPVNFDEVWEDAYSDILIDIRTMNVLATEGELYTHIAISQVIEAYVMMTLVDYFGDVPYSQALQGAENLNPTVDKAADIYTAVEALLDDAIVNFGKDELAKPKTDFFYGGNEDKWIKAANTLKLKLYVQTRLIDNSVNAKIDALIASGNYITTEADDFKFSYSTTDSNPDSRHPIFADNFDNGPSDYMSNYYMTLLSARYLVTDPRIRYYFYRQELDFSEADQVTKECVNLTAPSHFAAEDPFCTVGDGYWGRDHGNADGIPPDDQFRTLWGVYPVGGPFDDNSANTITNRNVGLFGAGISPFMMSSYVDFMLAESALTLGTTGDPRMYLENGINKSINTVMSFGQSVADTAFVPKSEVITLYLDGVLADYDAATNNDEKMQIIVEQYFIALWGNGVEAYNTYRRTGKPDNLQPTLLGSPGDFIRSFPYPGATVDNNSSVSQKSSQAVQVFWDNNPAGSID